MKPRLTKRILDGLNTAVTYANAGGPADIGLCPNSEEAEKEPGVEKRFQEVADAYDWVHKMMTWMESRPPRKIGNVGTGRGEGGRGARWR